MISVSLNSSSTGLVYSERCLHVHVRVTARAVVHKGKVQSCNQIPWYLKY